MAGARGSASGTGVGARGESRAGTGRAGGRAASSRSGPGQPASDQNGSARTAAAVRATADQLLVEEPAADRARAGRGAAGARTLTIGEACARLSVDFPGVTTGVLRRMEDAGTFTAGRSAAGYRRYSEADLDLIRRVLAHHQALYEQQQALSAAAGPGGWSGAGPDPADLSGAESPSTHPAAGIDPEQHARDLHEPEAHASGAHHGSSGGGAGARAASRTARAGSSRSAARSAAAHRSADAAHEESQPSENEPLQLDALFDVPPPRASGLSQQAETVPAAQIAAPSPAPAASVPQNPADSAAQATVPSARRADRRWPDAEFFTPDLGEVRLDRDQLAAAARTDREWVDGLVKYGLLPDERSAGGADLMVAKASAELARFGVEPRHLRAVAASAARVADLISTATTPAAGRESARRERPLLAAAPGQGAEAAAAAVRLHAALVRAALLRG